MRHNRVVTSQAPGARPYRGVPADQRRARRRAALLAAGLELLGTQGWAATTVRKVCAEAGLNDRYFYESFPDRDALLLAIVDEQVARGTDVILSAARRAPRHPQARTRAVVTAVFDFLTTDPRRAHILTHAFPSSPCSSGGGSRSSGPWRRSSPSRPTRRSTRSCCPTWTWN
ncbi:TetR/AcrR family transcriptional regulator [Actinomadura luteofluorescens]|uniref:TetR/AcrR family transcriptional regulator n=1 Tax=Actinomadura luteofluorescens TaxID=46163 RepID=UPI003631D7F8